MNNNIKHFVNTKINNNPKTRENLSKKHFLKTNGHKNLIVIFSEP